MTNIRIKKFILILIPFNTGRPQEALFDDGTPWSKLADPDLALVTAALDVGLMAARCNATSVCGWFSMDGTADLHSYLPLASTFKVCF